MKGDQVSGILFLQSRSNNSPHLRMVIAANIAAGDPDDIRAIFVALSQPGSGRFGIVNRQEFLLHHASPGDDHAEVDTRSLSLIRDIVHVIPVIVRERIIRIVSRRCVRLGRIGIDKRRIAVIIFLRQLVDEHHLNDTKAFVAAVMEVDAHLVPVQFLRQLPGGVAKPKERLAVFLPEETAIGGNL